MVAELVAIAVVLVAGLAELQHLRRTRRLARLAFGPEARPRPWVKFAPGFRVASLGALAWGLTTLLIVPAKSFRSDSEVPPGKEQHLLVVLDVSPSMRLADSGPTGQQTRKQRARDLMRSILDRVPMEQYLVSVVAVYNGAKPVVVDSRDLDVVDGIMGDLPLYQAFDPGQTRLLEGLREAAVIAKPWNPRSATIVVLTDGDSVPPQGMPAMPASVGDVLIVGVGDPVQGSFIDGKQSKQDVFTLRQVAKRLKGHYHDGNANHLPTKLISEIVSRGNQNQEEPWTRREYAILAIAVSAACLAVLPLLLEHWGTGYLPGVRLRTAIAPTDPSAGARQVA